MNPWRQLIEARMAERRFTTAELARRAGLSRQTLYSILSNDEDTIKELPGRKTVEALATALDLPIDQLLLAAAQACGIPVNTTVLVQPLTATADSDLARELLERAVRREAQPAAPLDLSAIDGASVLALVDLRRSLLADAQEQRQALPGLARVLDHLAAIIADAFDAAASDGH